MSSPIYTIGHEANYDAGLIKYGDQFQKLGRHYGYSGGYALRTVADARRLIRQSGKQDDYAVYEVDADWDRDTVPSEVGWWHVLINTSRITRKIKKYERQKK